MKKLASRIIIQQYNNLVMLEASGKKTRGVKNQPQRNLAP